MSEINPVLQSYAADGTATDSNLVAAQNRLTVLTRNSGFARAILWQTGQTSVGATDHLPFMNGTNWDMTVDGSSTSQTFSVSATSTTRLIVGVGLLILTTSRPPIFNGASFGGQFLGGLLGQTLITPAALANGLLFSCSAAGVTTNFANLRVNEDFYTGNQNAQFGSTGGPYLMRAKWDINQLLTGGSSDKLSFTVRDDLTARGIAEVRAMAMSVFA